MGFGSEEEYLIAANAVIANPDALHELEAEDNDYLKRFLSWMCGRNLF